MCLADTYELHKKVQNAPHLWTEIHDNPSHRNRMPNNEGTNHMRITVIVLKIACVFMLYYYYLLIIIFIAFE